MFAPLPLPPNGSLSLWQANFTLPKQMDDDIRGLVAAARVMKEATPPE